MKPKPISLLRTAELLAAPPPPMLIDGLIVRQGITGISADPGRGKTFLALEMMRCILMGLPLFDRFKTRHGSILFIGQDCSYAQYAQQARKVFGKYIDTSLAFERDGETTILKPFDHVRWLIHQKLDLSKALDCAAIVDIARSIPNLAYDPDVPIDYVDVIVEREGRRFLEWEPVYGSPNGVSLIVLDTWSKLHSADENTNSAMIPVMSNVRTLAEQTEAAILLLHHHSYSSDSNPGNRWRGASSQIGDIDTHLEIQGAGGRGPGRRLKTRKFRGIPTEDFKFEMHTTETECWFDSYEVIPDNTAASGNSTSPATSHAEAFDEFLANLTEGQEFATSELVDYLVANRNVSESSANVRASELLKRAVDRVTSSKRGVWKVVTPRNS